MFTTVIGLFYWDITLFVYWKGILPVHLKAWIDESEHNLMILSSILLAWNVLIAVGIQVVLGVMYYRRKKIYQRVAQDEEGFAL